MPEQAGVEGSVVERTAMGADGHASSKRGSTVCTLCLEKLSTPAGAEHTNRTTMLRPVISERLAGKAEAASASDDGALVIPAKPAGSSRTGGLEIEPSSALSAQAPADGTAAHVARRFGSYEILGEISRGSFGVVYKAKQRGLDRIVALKVLLAGVHASNEAVGRFQREAKAVARLKHPNIVPVYDIGTHDGHHYFAMEFVEGSALSELIAKGSVSTHAALEIGEALADALEVAHRNGVIHRDIKPSNIIVDAEGQPHITDFGLAKQVDLDTKFTMSGTTLGTPAYMPPEQARGEVDKIDARSDVYAIGAVLFEMLTGRTPFVGRSLLEVVVAVINEPVKPPRQINPRIHRDVQTIVLKCLEKDPRQRYASAADLRDDLQRFRSGEAIRAKPAGIVRVVARQVKRHRWAIGLLAAASVAMLLLTYEWRKSETEQQKITKKTNDLQKKLDTVMKSQQPVWQPDWWFPPKDPKSFADDQQRKQYAIPEGKGEAFKGFARGKDVPDPQVQKARTPDGADSQDVKLGRLNGGETLVSPEECRFFGDLEAKVCFTISQWGPDRRLRIGLQSLAKGYDGIPYLVEFCGGVVRLLGPVDLYSHTSLTEGDKKPPAPLVFEIKAEKEAQDMVPGQYVFTLRREGMQLSVSLTGPEDFSSVKLDVKDLNLSSWVFKNTQIVVRQPPQGLQFISAEVQRKIGGEGGDAFRYLREGEYSVAETELKTITERGEDRLLKARAWFQLGLLQEICQPRVGRELTYYTNSLTELERLAPDEARAGERARLATEVRFRRMVRFARNRQWQAVNDELYRGWGQDGKIGEPLAWELDTVLDVALRQPAAREGEQKDSDKAQGLLAALGVFGRLGLPPGSASLGRYAVLLANALVAERRFAELQALYEAYPTRMLNKSFCEAVGKALETTDGKPVEAEQFDTGLALLGKMEARTENDAILRNRATCDLLSAGMKAHRYADVGQLYAQSPNPELLKIACQRIEEQARDLAENDPYFYAFLSKVLPVVKAALPSDPAASAGLYNALEKIAVEIIAGGRVSKLIKLHEGLRGTRPYDAHLARCFVDAVTRLSIAGGAGAEMQALALLKYSVAHVARDDRGLQSAVLTFARRHAAADDARSYSLILTLQRAYPTPQLLKQASELMLELRRTNRYEEMVIFFSQARVEFGQEARVLTPLAIAALENVGSTEQRAQLLSSLWFTVHGEFDQRQLVAADRQWQMEYADIELVLNQWEKARERYQGLYNAKDVEPELLARVGLRLGIICLARPSAGRASDVLLPLLAMNGVPEEFKTAARLLATPDQTRLDALDGQLKAANVPLKMTDAEWDLIRGMRLRMDGNQAQARDALSSAARKSDPARAWVNSVATQLLRSNLRSPDDDSKGENEKPPERAPPAPSLNFPKQE